MQSPASCFDWYSLSKLNEQAPNLSQFAQLIRSTHLESQLPQVPNSLRQKLLTVFQSAWLLLKQLSDHESTNETEILKE
jgi:hypothetical protein